MLGGKRKSSTKRKSTTKRKSSTKQRAAAKKNPWLIHVKKTSLKNPKMLFSQVLKLAKKTYKK